jgi:hypothetical protein
MADKGGENGGGWEGMDARDIFGSARSCWMLLRWNADVSWEFGLRSRTVTESRVATAAENKPVYDIPGYGCTCMNNDTRAHKKEDPFGISLPAADCLIIFFLSNLQVHGEEWP